ncbi:MAG: alpha-hydroxy acid oxidase, partial [Pseudomonadota bacterium]
GGVGPEVGLKRNRVALDEVQLVPHQWTDVNESNCKSEIFGKTYEYPFGVAPVGMSGLIWPKSARMLARAAKMFNVPFTLSTTSTCKLDDVRAEGGENTWFQMYVPKDEEITRRFVKQLTAAAYSVLLVTVDLPIYAFRERDIRNGLSLPPSFGARSLFEIISNPSWALRSAAVGVPQFVNVLALAPNGLSASERNNFVDEFGEGRVTLQKLKLLRDLWPGSLVVKGILTPDDASQCKAMGVDGVVVSNHGARQMDAAPAPIEVLPQIRAAVGEAYPLLVDGGCRSGLDVARMIASGADFVLMGRAPYAGVAAMGERGALHTFQIIADEFQQTLCLTGCENPKDLRKVLWERSDDKRPVKPVLIEGFQRAVGGT